MNNDELRKTSNDLIVAGVGLACLPFFLIIIVLGVLFFVAVLQTATS